MTAKRRIRVIRFGADLAVDKRLGKNLFQVQIGGSSPRLLAEQLSGWGKGIDVIGPQEVRRHLARIGAEQVEAHQVTPRNP